MAVDRTQAVYVVNEYLLANPTFADLMKYTGRGVKPIFPAQEPREATDPFIRYVLRTGKDGNMWWLMTDNITYAVYSSSVVTAAKIINKMVDLLGREDESAIELNAWIDYMGGSNWNFQSSELVTTLSPESTTQEGGMHMSLITIRVKYTADEIRQTNFGAYDPNKLL